MLKNLEKYQIILASKSPRRQQLLADLGIPFKVVTNDVDEIYPSDLELAEIPVFLAKLKLKPFVAQIDDKTIVITSDTIVCVENEMLGKPKNDKEAFQMLSKLSGKVHQVSTGVCIHSNQKSISFTTSTNVKFKELRDSEIRYYIEKFQPFDKAGAYGIQEWIGYIAIESIEGSYFNVMGLPLHQLYEALQDF